MPLSFGLHLMCVKTLISPLDKNGTEGDKTSSDQIEVAITNEEKPKQTYAKDHKFTEEER